MKRILLIFAAVAALVQGISAKTDDPVVVAYFTSRSATVPDPELMTHINFAFGRITDSFDGLIIDSPDNLRRITGMKKDHSHLKVLLSIGGWTCGNFSEMAADEKLRQSFVADCLKAVKEFDLDGIDIDWEYPTSSAAGISSSPDDTANFTLLMRDLRKALGAGRLLTIATIATADFIDFPAIMPYVDMVNIMSYDMNKAPHHHAPLRTTSDTMGPMSVEKAVRAHLDAGVPADKLTVGIPFYGRGVTPYTDFCDFGKMPLHDGCTFVTDSLSGAPYIAGPDGALVLGFDNAESVALKCDYLLDAGLRGAMYWEYDCDDDAGTLRRTVAEKILGVRK